MVLAVVAAGALSVSVATAQSTASAATKPVNKKSSTANTSHATSSSTSKKHTSSKKSGKHTKKVKGQAAPTSDRITEIQDALAKKGVFTGTPTGKWDDSTVDAMKHFQTANGLTPSGKLDALTLQKLGLGSETAGIAAPTPPPNSANRLKNLSSLPQDPPEDSSTNRPEK
ncbi:MAG TPA: peptidoglycan-binding domain-containing protein [Verrucomicrobiae bacterium]|nr:peptidoglycan-binding domain-containing protein [Verrucomicrobiae bacterium]